MKLYAQLQPIVENEIINPIDNVQDSSSSVQESSVVIYDLGKNITGYPRIKVTGESGSKVTVRASEILNDDGSINYKTSGREWRLEYTLKGEGDEEWQPRFTNSSFRYIEISVEGSVKLLSIEGIHAHSKLEQVGEFNCSNSLINKIQDAYLLSQTGNLMGFPTDCPHRERLGWLGDAMQIGVSSSYNYDMQYFWKKWYRDMNDDLQSNGSIHQLIPFPNYQDEQDPVWQSASIIMPWESYWFYGDESFLTESYYRMGRLMDYYQSISSNYIIEKNRWGDWVKPFPEDTNTGAYLTTSYYYRCAVIMGDVAKVLGNVNDESKYSKLALNIKDAINEEWFSEGHYDMNRQTSSALALDFGFSEAGSDELLLDNLVKDIAEHDNHLTTGVVGQMPLVSALHRYKRDDLIYELVKHKTFPSLGYMIENGATTFWERYSYGTGGMDSHNHVFLGGPHAKWFYDGLAGISALQPGFKVIKIAPSLLEDKVNVSFKSPYGLIKCEWIREENSVDITIVVPFNTTAMLHIPTGGYSLNTMTINSGDGIVWQSGTGQDIDNMIFKGVEDNSIIYELQPGTYNLNIKE